MTGAADHAASSRRSPLSLAARLARWNHVFIPQTKEERDRYRTGRVGRVLGPVLGLYYALSVEGRFLAMFALLAGALGLEVRENQVHLVWCASTGALVAALLLRRFYALPKVEVTLEHPARVTLGEALEVGLELRNHGTRAHHALRVEGPMLPWDGSYEGEAPTLAALVPGTPARLEVLISFVRRGEHHLDPFRVSALVPLGLTTGPAVETAGARFLVLPKVARIGRFELPLGTRYQPGGVKLAAQTGEARELVGLRPYRPGDPVRDLHHRAWARRGEPVVREYREEFFTRIGVVLDTEGGDERRLEAAISLAAGVLAHVGRADVLIDLLVVGDHLHRLTLGRSLGYLEQALDLLAVVEPISRFDGTNVASLLAPHLARLSALVIVAQRWDGERRVLLDLARGRGVGVRALVLEGPGGEAGVAPIALADVEAGEVWVP